MRCVRSLEVVLFDPKIERIIRGLRRVVEQQATMNNEAMNITLRKYGVLSINDTNSNIQNRLFKPTILKSSQQ